MGVIYNPSTIWLLNRVQSKNDFDYFPPISSFFCGIEETQISHKMPLVIGSKIRGDRRFVIEG